ncbi:MAG: hypothetical protein KJ653_05235 [Candidatus Thermoplasmatota archaeon]|nr:hypothetical protein [Candidatus Thermoplasmatota archaeon]
MEKVNRIEEPAVERWSEDESVAVDAKDAAAVVDFPFFRLSGGMMRENAKTSNRIDGLLMRMMEHPSHGRYHPNVDKNLDYLFTYLQLDMIGMVANDVSEMNRKRSEGAPRPDPASGIISEE